MYGYTFTLSADTPDEISTFWEDVNMTQFDNPTCSRCGMSNTPGAQFCSRCGASLTSVSMPFTGYQSPLQGSMQDVNKIAAGLLAIFLGWTGAHGFYTKNYTMGIIILGLSLLGFLLTLIGIGVLIVSGLYIFTFVQGIMYLVNSDLDFYRKYVLEKRWI